MKRRQFLLTAAAGVLSPAVVTASVTPRVREFGWIPGADPVDKLAYKATGVGKGQIRCLWHGRGLWIPRQQKWMDCVAFASAAAIDLVNPYDNKISTDMIYAGGRHVFGSRNGPGMMGSWAADWLTQYGKLYRQKYGRYDLRPYSRKTCRYWDRRGVPRSLGKVAKKDPVISAKLVDNWDQCCDAVVSGNPIVFCCYFGVEDSVRDQEGYVIPRGQWAHGWCLAGIDDRGDRPGACIINSHGYWASGPKKLGQPDGSVWIDREHIEKQLSENRDCYAICTN